MKIVGTGTAFPPEVVANPSWTDQWVRDNLGIANRHTGGLTSTLAAEAAENALNTAGVDPRSVDMVIVATASPDRLAPATATRVQETIGASNAFAFDINAVCSGWLYGLTIANQFLESGQARTIVVVGADTFSNFTDYSHRDWVFFGDGAGAAVITQDGEPFLTFLQSDGKGWDSWTIRGGGAELDASKWGSTWEMVGSDVYTKAVDVVPDAVTKLLTFHEIEHIDWFVPHQASLRVLQEIARKLGIPWERVACNLWHKANTAAASMPTALHTVVDNFQPGDTILFAAIGAGWTWGAGVMQWT